MAEVHLHQPKTMKYPMVDLKGQYEKIKTEIDAAVLDVIESTKYINGPEVSAFADHLSEYLGGPFVVPCANGTDALQIALMALDCQPGDEIIVPVHTYVATAEVIALLNLVPVFVEVDQTTFNIDVDQIEDLITEKTKAIVPVHLYGQVADMEPLMKIALEHGIYVLEDTAQAIGAEYTCKDGRKLKAGTIGTIGTTSFFPSKNLGCYGDGGAMFTGDEKIAKRLKMMANHGQGKKYHHDEIGCNSRLDTIQAAILDIKLGHLDEYNSVRQLAAERYNKLLADVSEVTTPFVLDRSTHVYHQYTLQLAEEIDRDQVKDDLAEAGIPSMIYYTIPLHLQKAYRREGFGEGSFPVTEQLSRTVLSLPIHTELEESVQIDIVNELKKAIAKQK